MKIAVLSGKGGTGKTFVSVNLAAATEGCTYIDCDVEEPNGHLFFRPHRTEEKSVAIRIPVFHKDQCIGCKKCVEFCAFHALAFVKKTPMLFPEVCHSCGGCLEVCESQAITEAEKVIGFIQKGMTEYGTYFLGGQMNIGEVSAVPIIKKLLEEGDDCACGDVVIDCPPGSGCMVMESIQEADYCTLVAEPTVFGRHNLQMVYELTRLFQKPVGVVLNKCTEEENPSELFCIENNIPIIGRISFDRNVANENAKGVIVAKSSQEMGMIFEKVRTTIEEKVGV